MLVKSTILLLICIGSIMPEEMSELCLGCLCQASSGCRQTPKCEKDAVACGLFHITKFYWIDAGQPTINGQSPKENDAFSNCVTDPFCAAQTVKSYMKKLAKDCNGDGVINCEDYAAMHKNGGYQCSGDLPVEYVSVFKECLAAAPNNGK